MLSAIAAALLYLLAAGLQARRMDRPEGRPAAAGCAVAALACHGYIALQAVAAPQGINLGFFKVSALIFFFVNLYFLCGALRRPVFNLGIVLFPLAAAAVLVAALAPGSGAVIALWPDAGLGPEADSRAGGLWPGAGLLAHIGVSLLAHAVLTLAACQAAAVAVLDWQLRHPRSPGPARIFPPLQVMEKMLFELLRAGLALLTAAIGSGLLFLEDIFAQHLAHKTVLTIAAWLLFAALLWGHHRLGWRSRTAVRFTLSGFGVLMLGYFGSKLALEVILQRV